MSATHNVSHQERKMLYRALGWVGNNWEGAKYQKQWTPLLKKMDQYVVKYNDNDNPNDPNHRDPIANIADLIGKTMKLLHAHRIEFPQVVWKFLLHAAFLNVREIAALRRQHNAQRETEVLNSLVMHAFIAAVKYDSDSSRNVAYAIAESISQFLNRPLGSRARPSSRSRRSVR